MDQMTITFLTASTALIAGVAGPIVSISIARQQFKASVISNNRERWTEALRDALAEYISLVTSAAMIARQTQFIHGENVHLDEEFRKTAERIMLVRGRIRLMTNPSKDCHRELCESVEAVHRALVAHEKVELQQWRSHLEAIMLAGRSVLEAEWRRVKRGD